MRNDELNQIWLDVEAHGHSQNHFFQRMIYVDLLYRVYIGSSGTPPKRFLSIEIPKEKEHEFDAFTVPQGFTLSIREPLVKHDGYETCVLQSVSFDQNDVFTILAKDILDELLRQKEADQYIASLKKRIEKWRFFFKNPFKKILNDKAVIGLIGELSFLELLWKNGISIAPDLWNGPIKAAQDFQGNEVAIEVKTSAANILNYVNISSEAQLNNKDYFALFLIVFRVERNDATGTTLPAMVKRIENVLTEQQKLSFQAKLTCLGYSAQYSNSYQKGYSVKEIIIYKVDKGFPKLTPDNLPHGVMDICYRVSLQACEDYKTDLNSIFEAIKEYEYGEDGGTDQVL